MKKLFEKVILPAHRLFSGRNILPHLRAQQIQQWLSYPDLVDLQNRKLRQLLIHAFKNVPFYRRKFSQVGLSPDHIQSAEDLVRLPPLTKEDIRTNTNDLMATNYRKKDLVPRSTGGSTGVPTDFYYDRSSWDSRVAAGYLAFTWAGWDFGVRRAILTGSFIEKAVFQSFRGKLKSILFRELVLDTFEMSEQIRRQYIKQLLNYRPKILYGYASACFALAKQLLRDNVFLSIPSIVISAEMIYPTQRDLIEEAFHAKVFNLYGSREISAIGMECDLHTGLHTPINRLVVEILGNDKPLAAGEDGEIVITDLHNYGMPFIRYKIGDVGKLLGVECPCGRKTPLLELTHGRITDIIVTPDGKYLPGMFFPHLFKEISSYVEQFQIIQARIDELLVKIVPNSSYGPRQTEYLRRKIEEKLGPTIKVSFELVKIIPPEKSGKHRVTISKLHTASTFDNNLTSLTKKG